VYSGKHGGRSGVNKLKPPLTGFRLRCGDYGVFFELKDENAIEITGVKNRREAYH
jgi:mRNA-degrading endonuclease RelE of RelBE toxin-antitoxin system